MNAARIGRTRTACALAVVLATSGCDQFDDRGEAPLAASATVAMARRNARGKLEATMEAAEAVAASCVAAELIWEADPSGYVVPRHFSRPCLPERCAPKPAALAALKSSAAALDAQIKSEPSLQVPSFESVAALADAMLRFAEVAQSSLEKRKRAAAAVGKQKGIRGPARWAADSLTDKSHLVKPDISPFSGLSMHYTALARAFMEVYPDAKVPVEPVSLTASLSSAQPGGDPCKGWALPKYCDVKSVTLVEPRRWRTDPVCIEVLGVPK